MYDKIYEISFPIVNFPYEVAMHTPRPAYSGDFLQISPEAYIKLH